MGAEGGHGRGARFTVHGAAGAHAQPTQDNFIRRLRLWSLSSAPPQMKRSSRLRRSGNGCSHEELLFLFPVIFAFDRDLQSKDNSELTPVRERNQLMSARPHQLTSRDGVGDARSPELQTQRLFPPEMKTAAQPDESVEVL